MVVPVSVDADGIEWLRSMPGCLTEADANSAEGIGDAIMRLIEVSAKKA